MASRSDQGVIPCRFDFVPKDVKVMKCAAQTVNNNVTSKVSMEVPIVPIGGSKAQYLHMLSRFRKAQRILNWTNGATLYANFQNQLEDTSEWDAVSHPFAQSVVGFGEAIDAHLLLLFPADAWEIHRNMVINRKKGIKESPSEFMSRISFHDIALGLLPGWPGANVGAPEQQLTEYDKKQILYNGVPEEYRESFRKAGMSLTTVSLNDLIKYMDDLYSMDHTAQRALHASNNSSSSHTRPAGRVPGRGNRSGDTSSRPGFRPYSEPRRFPSGRGRPYGGNNYGRPYYRPYYP